jgi:diguanylate cyclase (GGDEF)-like protein
MNSFDDSRMHRLATYLNNRFQIYYQGQKIAGKLNLVLLFLLTLFLANSLFVVFSLYVSYQSNEALSRLGKFEKLVDDARLSQWRFRVSRERGDEQAASDALSNARLLLDNLPAHALKLPLPDGRVQIEDLMTAFENSYREYMYYYEQTAALESGMRKVADDLLQGMEVLQQRPESKQLRPLLASIVQRVLGARIVQQEFVISRDMRLGNRMQDSVNEIDAEAARFRARSAHVPTQIEAYNIGRQARLMGSSFEKLRGYALKTIAKEERMNITAAEISDYVNKAIKQRLAAFNQQMILIVASIVLASIFIVMLGLLLGRRFVKGITSPLTRLVESSVELARGNYNQSFESSRQDEIGELATSFGNMAQTVKQHINTLSESERQVRQRTVDLEISNRLLGMAMNSAKALNESLEDKVLQRTAELEAANRKLSELTVTDALTGLANRRHFDAVIIDEWSRAGRTGQALAVIMLDIDYFKLYNDGYGHQAGDACLRQVAKVLQSGVQRPGDLVARYGGEEFVVVATDADLTTARELAENMRRSVEALSIPHEYSRTAKVVTVSMGLAVMNAGDKLQPEELLQHADEALYRAKDRGRNQVAD